MGFPNTRTITYISSRLWCGSLSKTARHWALLSTAQGGGGEKGRKGRHGASFFENVSSAVILKWHPGDDSFSSLAEKLPYLCYVYAFGCVLKYHLLSRDPVRVNTRCIFCVAPGSYVRVRGYLLLAPHLY